MDIDGQCPARGKSNGMALSPVVIKDLRTGEKFGTYLSTYTKFTFL